MDDLIRGLYLLATSGEHLPVNLGNPDEFTLLELANTVLKVTGASSPIVFEALPVDDPQVRQPDITRAQQVLGWEPEVALEEGLRRLVASVSRSPVVCPSREQPSVEVVDVAYEAADRVALEDACTACFPHPLRASPLAASWPRRSASASTSPGSTRKPSTPSRITSETPPTRVATTGLPAARASMALTGVPSFADGRMSASNDA